MPIPKHPSPLKPDFSQRLGQFGGGLLPVVAVAGVVMAMAHGTIYYKAKTSSAFLSGEKNKVLAMQAAEAGVEDAVSKLGTRRVIVSSGVTQVAIATNQHIGDGAFSTSLRTVSVGGQADTVDLLSQGGAKGKTQSVQARLRLRSVYDTVKTVVGVTVPVDTTRFDSTITTTTTSVVKDPNTVPDLNTTAAYTACMASSAKKCDVCHLPGGDVSKANVINISKSAISTHITHHGDYITTDGTCDVFQPKTVITKDTTVVAVTFKVSHLVYSTTTTVDTAVKIQFLSWK
jgi:hypothetical protein